MAKGYLIDFYVPALALKRAELAALPEGDEGAESLKALILDLEHRKELALKQPGGG